METKDSREKFACKCCHKLETEDCLGKLYMLLYDIFTFSLFFLFDD